MAALKSIVSNTPTPNLARVLELVLYAVSALWLVAVGAGALAIADIPGLFAPALAVVLVLTIVVAALGLTFFSSMAELYGQHARDLQASLVLSALRDGREPPPYSVYLRPFASTDAISEIGMGTISVSATSGANALISALAGARVELEAQVERAVRPLGLLVALGQPLEHVGAGRIPIGESEWRDVVKLLVTHAQLIIMLPSAHKGTLEEIEMILDSGLIQRTVLIDPPNFKSSIKKFDHGAEWGAVREVFAKRGYDVPEDSRVGRLLFYGAEHAPRFKEQLDIDADDRIERLFRRVIHAIKSLTASAA